MKKIILNGMQRPIVKYSILFCYKLIYHTFVVLIQNELCFLKTFRLDMVILPYIYFLKAVSNCTKFKLKDGEEVTLHCS